jgi:WD40 repeat protein
LRKHEEKIISIDVSPCGKYIASAQKGSIKSKIPYSTIILWDLKTFKPIHIFKKHLNIVYCLSFSHDEKFLASSGDNGICIWECETGLLTSGMNFDKPVTFSINIFF